jgi:heme-degrading monooxygenase HmoA
MSKSSRESRMDFARIGTWQGTPEELERWIVRAREQVKPSIQKDRGLKAVYWLVDREAGKGLIVTLWESREAMAASEQARLQRQTATSAATGASVTTERYEVVDSFLP